MAGLEEQLNAVLSNPQMMQQIMAMAQNFGAPPEPPPPQPQQPDPPPPPQLPVNLPVIDPGMLQKLSGFIGQEGVDKNQQLLLKALTPYISKHRVIKLEKAMQAAKMAKLATSLFGNSRLGR